MYDKFISREILAKKTSHFWEVLIANGRSDRIRTYDPLVPSQVLYQTELRPDFNFVSHHYTPSFHRRTDAKHKQAIYEIVVVKKWCDWRDSNPRPTA